MTGIGKIKRPAPLRDEVYQRLKTSILTNQLTPGTPLLEEDLADELGISRTPLREVLTVLEGEGLVKRTPHRGAFVADISPDDINHLYELRELLEGLAARKAATAIPLAELAVIDEQFRHSADQIARGEYALYYRSHAAMHQAILIYARNPMLEQILEVLKERVQRLRAFAGSSPERHVHEAYHEQRRLLDALLARDPVAAEAAMSSHLRQSQRRVTAQLTETMAAHDKDKAGLG